MFRKLVQLVRAVERSEYIEAIVESPAGETIESVEPADLWFLLTTSGVLPEIDDEIDSGIGVFVTEYDVSKHASLPVVSLGAWDLAGPSSPPLLQPIPLTRPTVSETALPKNRRSVREAVRMTRSLEQYEIKRMVVEAPTAELLESATCEEAIGEGLGDKMWWGLPNVIAEVDESLSSEYAVEHLSHEAHEHLSLPSVVSEGRAAFGELLPPPEFLAGWQPSTLADEKDIVESERVRSIVVTDPNQCYHNARRTLRSLPEYHDAFYVEGYIVTHDGAIFEHGWLLKGGKIVDQTILHEHTLYFAGLEFGGSDQVRAFLRTEWGCKVQGLPFHWAFGKHGSKSSSFQAAFQRARACLLERFGVDAMEAAARIRAENGLPWPR